MWEVDVKSLEFSTSKIMSSMDKDNFTFSFSVWTLLFFLPPTRPANTMSNEKGKGGNTWLVSVRRVALSLPPLIWSLLRVCHI